MLKISFSLTPISVPQASWSPSQRWQVLSEVLRILSETFPCICEETYVWWFIHFFSCYLLRTFCVPGSVVRTELQQQRLVTRGLTLDLRTSAPPLPPCGMHTYV